MNEITGESAPIAVDELDLASRPSVQSWTPQWILAYGKDDEAGIAVDDHCLVVFAKDWQGNWRPLTHIPPEVAERLGDYVGYCA